MEPEMRTQIEMTHKERIERTLNGQAIDRPAVSAWRHFYNRENTRNDFVNVMIEFQRKFDWDFMKINPRASYHIEDWGAIQHFSKDPLIKPITSSFPIHKKQDWAKIGTLDWTAGTLGETLAATGDLVNEMQNEIHIIQTVFSPLSIAADLTPNEELFVRFLHDGPGELHQALEAITETFIGFTRHLVKLGISGIFFATTELASRDLLTEEEYIEFGQPYDFKILRAAASAPFNVVHVCNKYNMLPLFREYPVPVLSWNPFDEGNLSIHQAAQITDKIFLTGVDHNVTLKSGSPADIKLQIEKSLRQVPLGRMMVGPGCAIKVNTPDNNLKAVSDTVKGWKI